MLSPELLQKANHLFLKSRHKVTDVFSGEFSSAFRGRGIEFEEFREYSPGDDVRQIDWNVTARSQRPYIKVFREEREQTVFFVVDSSKSLDAGAHRSKRDVVIETTALMAYATLKSNDRVGLITFTDKIETFLPVKKGKAHVWRLISSLVKPQSQNKKTDINEALKFFLKVQTRRSTCILLSDFLSDINLEILKLVKLKHDLVCIRVSDPVEFKMPEHVLVDFKDLEDETKITFDGYKKNDTALSVAWGNIPRDCLRLGIDFLDLLTSDDSLNVLINYFIKREKKR